MLPILKSSLQILTTACQALSMLTVRPCPHLFESPTTLLITLDHITSLASFLFSGSSSCWPYGSGPFHCFCLECFVNDPCDTGSFPQFPVSAQIPFPQRDLLPPEGRPTSSFQVAPCPTPQSLSTRSPNFIVFTVLTGTFVTGHHQKDLSANWPLAEPGPWETPYPFPVLGM